jgi:DNA-binding CsgD family transcriptional regulator
VEGGLARQRKSTEVTVLLERERELDELAAAIGDARDGTGGLMAIEAQAGLGKTRLLHATRAAAAEAGLRVLTARATELERDFPFGLVRQLFEPQLAALPAPERDELFDGASAARSAFGVAGDSPPEQARDAFSVLHGLYWMTAAVADRVPLLLAVDDAHWSDAASLDYLGFLLPRLDEIPVLVVVTCRPDGSSAARGLDRIVTDGAARRLAPRALSRDAAAALLGDELGREPEAELVTTCHEVSGGNPFLLCELARALVAQAIDPGAAQASSIRDLMPERVARTVLARVARLPPEARAVARALAVLGDGSDHRLVAELAELDASAARRGADALRGGAILDPGEQLRFIHPLVRSAMHSDLQAGERAEAHARAAELLRAAGASPEQIAGHLAVGEARGDVETVETLLAAGRRALASGAPQSAVAYLRRALREPPPPELRAAVLRPLIVAGIRAADHSVYDAIESDLLAELDRDQALRSRWGTNLATFMALNGRFDRAIELLEAAIETAEEEGDVERAFRHEAQLSTFAQLRPATARARLERYRGRVDPDSAGGRLVAALDSYWVALDGSAAEAAGLARRALSDGRIFAEQPEITAPAGAVQMLLLANDFDGARQGADHALAIARERNATPELAGAWFLQGTVAWACGDLAAAEADARQAVEIARLGGLPAVGPVLTTLLVDVLIERGELDAADAELDGLGVKTAEIPDLLLLHGLLFERGRLRLEQGRLEQAAADLLELQRRREQWGVGAAPMLQPGPYAARALTALGEIGRARAVAERDLAHSRRWGAPTGVSRALRAVGLTTPGPDGLELLTEAVAVLDDSPARLLRAHALADLGTALRREKRRADARPPLREALDLARRCGAARLAKRAHDELRATGEKVRRHTPIGVESLTPSERRVAEMAASGMTNREIAQTLFLTVKTIETHLSAAYGKLGIRSRRQLPGVFEAADRGMGSAWESSATTSRPSGSR